MHRRKFLQLVGATLAAGFSTKASAQAQSWPERTVKVILPYAPGGATDAIGRPWADKLSQAFGQQFVIENRGGAGGMIGAEAAAKSPPDGYTFFLTPNAPLSVVPTLRKTAYDPVKSFDPVGRVGDVVCGFVIHPSVGIKTLQGDDRVRQEEPGQAHLRLVGQRHCHSPAAGDAQAQGRHRHPARALSRRRRFAQRRAARHRAHDERARVAAARQGRQADPAQHQRQRAAPRFPRRADADGARHHRRRRADLVLDLRAGRHAQGHHLQAQREDDRDRQDRRHEGQDARRERLRAAADARKTWPST